MTKVLHFDLANGISGDMAISALVHAGRRMGLDVEGCVTATITSLGLGCGVSFVDDERGGLACLRTEIKTDDKRYRPSELRDAIGRSELEDAARVHALDALTAIVEAEASVHGVDSDAVHLHELGSADTAADLAGAAAAIAALDVETVTAATVPVPSGWIDADHGPLPLPAPVTLELLRGAKIRGVEQELELVTPTGAAILKTYVSAWGPVPQMLLTATGIGGGTRKSHVPNICRALIGERPRAKPNTELCVVLETNIDDQTPEAVGHVLELLMEHGALDVWLTNIVMKRSRPAFALSVLVRPDDETRLTDLVFRHTTTLGVRRRESTRSVLDREMREVAVDGCRIAVKIGRLGDEVVNIAPEFADCVAASKMSGVPVKKIYAEARRLAEES